MDQNSPLASAVRTIGAAVIGRLSAKFGLGFDDSTAVDIAGAVGVIGLAAWGMLSKRMPALLQSAARFDDVAKILVKDPQVAVSVPSNKVVNGQ